MTSGRVDKWDEVLEWDVIKGLNICCYYKDKQEEEKQRMLQLKQQRKL